MSSSVRVTSYPAIKNAPLIGLAEGNGSFNNIHLAGLVLVVPYFLKWFLPVVNRGGFKTYLFLLVVSGVPTTVAYWTVMSNIGARRNEKVALPGRDIEEYITIKDSELKRLYKGKDKIPMQTFHDAYFDGKIDFNGQQRVLIPTTILPDVFGFFIFYLLLGDVLDIMEARHDWAKFNFTMELFKYVFTVLIPVVVSHSQLQDEEQVRDHYDRRSRLSQYSTLTLTPF